MPRHPDPDLEDRIVCAADVLWRRGGEKALTMRAVAEAAGTNTPAVYRRFKNRQALVRALILRIVARIREEFEQKETPEQTAEAYVEFALRNRNEYLLFYSHAWALNPPRGRRGPRPIRESRPNFAFTEKLLAKELGGSPKDHTQTADRAVGDAAWDGDAVAEQVDSRGTRRGIAHRLPSRSENVDSKPQKRNAR